MIFFDFTRTVKMVLIYLFWNSASACKSARSIQPFWAVFFCTWQQQGVSSVPFPFWFPFQLHFKLVCSGIRSQSVQNILICRVIKNERPILVLFLLRFSEMTSELITFNCLRYHSSSRALGTRTGYWKLTQRGTDRRLLNEKKGKITTYCQHFKS